MDMSNDSAKKCIYAKLSEHQKKQAAQKQILHLFLFFFYFGMHFFFNKQKLYLATPFCILTFLSSLESTGNH